MSTPATTPRLPLRLATVIVLVLALVAHVIPAPPSSAAVHGYYRAPWSDKIHEVSTDGAVRGLTYAQWRAAGSPAPRIAPVRYVKNSWSSTVYGLITWPHRAGDDAVDQVATLTAANWERAGKPRPSTVARVPGTQYLTWASNASQIFAYTPDNRTHRLTLAQWRAAGSPTPTARTSGYYRAPWSDKIHRVDGAQVRGLTLAQWRAYGSPTPARTPVRYVQMPWDDTIYGLITWPQSPTDRSVDQVAALSFSEWSRAGKPAPQRVDNVPGGTFVQFPRMDTIFHSYRGTLAPLTFSQWQWAGSPAPRRQNAPSPLYIRGILVVNKSFPLPASYGNGLTSQTQSAFNSMRSDAARQGLSIFIASGFRSYDYQAGLYNRYVAQNGRAAADRFAARPGHSEHQTGLAVDVNSTSGSFGSTAEGRWVAANAHRYGFIVRYPEGKEHITGYMYEPWHLRYVGVETATHLYRNGLTLEEYLRVPSRY